MTSDEQRKPGIRILFTSPIAMGPGKAKLLQTIDRTGSISAAAREMGMSYRRAWLLVDTMNHSFREPLVETAAGGQGGGGTIVTPFGREILRRYGEMEEKAAACIAAEVDEFVQLVAPRLPE